MLLVIGGFVVHIKGEWEDDAPLTAAVAALLLVDVAGLVLGGSFWRDYLFPLLPGHRPLRGPARPAAHQTRRRDAVGHLGGHACRRSCSSSAGSATRRSALQEFDEVDTGKALQAVAEPGDSLVVFGGRADLQITSGMASPYEHLWSLPMRTMDPDLTDLDGRRRRAGRADLDRRVGAASTPGPSEHGGELAALVEERYEPHGSGCGTEPDDPRTVWLLKGTDRDLPSPACHAD